MFLKRVNADFTANVWVGDNFGGKSEFKGFTTKQEIIEVPMKEIVGEEEKKKSEDVSVILQKVGEHGRLYYRLGLSYAPKKLRLDAEERGFVVSRTYEPVESPSDKKDAEKKSVWKDEQGVWHFKAGSKIKVTVKLVNVGTRYHVAVVDSFPGGVEPLNAALKGTEKIPGTSSELEECMPFLWLRKDWYDHQNLRDERAEAFGSILYAGEREYTYYVRATTKGKFIVPPAKVEEMYSPEIFGRTASEIVVIH